MQTIEVIEDDTAMRALLSEWLQGKGYRVRAKSRIDDDRRTDVDLVVANLENLHVDGIDYVRRVRRLYENAVLIGLSTQVSRTHAAGSEQTLQLGLVRLIPKPCRSNELLAAVVEAIGPVL